MCNFLHAYHRCIMKPEGADETPTSRDNGLNYVSGPYKCDCGGDEDCHDGDVCGGVGICRQPCNAQELRLSSSLLMTSRHNKFNLAK